MNINRDEKIQKQIEELQSNIRKQDKIIREKLNEAEVKADSDSKGEIEAAAVISLATAKAFAVVVNYSFDSFVEQVAPLSEIKAWAMGKKDPPHNIKLNKITSKATKLLREFLLFYKQMGNLFNGSGDRYEVEFLTSYDKSLKEFLQIFNKYARN